MPKLPYRSWVEISRRQIADNFAAIRTTVGDGVEVMPVVKADAYRHGAAEVSRVLKSAGARWLAVSCVEEGIALREAGIGGRILIMAGFLAGEREALVDHNLTPVVHSLAGIRELDRLGAARECVIDYHLKIDSGMGRLGTRAEITEIIDTVRQARAARVEALMTHFASASSFDRPQTGRQMARFNEVTSAFHAVGLEPAYTHLAASAPIVYGIRETWGNMVRPGLAIYGYVSPASGPAPPLLPRIAPVLEWKAAILEIKHLPAGSDIGYDALFRTGRRTRVGVVAAGYGDGVPHQLSNRGKVLAAGRLVPIIGAVSMDVITVDLTTVPELGVGDAVRLIGRDRGLVLDAQDIATTAGTISYSVLCGISSRVKRIYR